MRFPMLFGVGIVITTLVMAVFAYLIAPDNSPSANAQFPFMAAQKPGFSVDILHLKTNKAIVPSSWWQTLCFGQITTEELLPVKSYRLQDNRLYAETYGNGVLRDLAASDLVRVEHRTFWLGTDRLGRCIYSRLLVGARVTLGVGVLAVLLSLFIGTVLGALAGYFGGKLDTLVMFVANVIWSVPTILFVFAVVLTFGRGIGSIFIAVGLTLWVETARLVRGEVQGLRQAGFVEAAHALGYSQSRIIVKHILPNILGVVLVSAAGNFASAILLEAGLSYLGFGIAPPAPSWGTMLNENRGFLTTSNAYLAILPGLAIMLLVLAFNLVANGLRDKQDKRAA